MEQTKDTVQKARSQYSHALLNLAIYGVFCLLVIMLLLWAAGALLGTNDLPILLKYCIQFGAMYLLGLPLYLFLSKNMPADPPEKHSLKIWHFLLIIPCLVCMMYAGNLIGVLVNGLIALLIGINTESTALFDKVFGESGYVVVIVAVMGAPIVEELLFRKVLIDRIRRYGNGKAILLSGFFFGMFHGNLSQFFYTAFVGLMFAFIYVRTGKVIYTILLHMTINFMGGALPYFIHADQVIAQLRAQNIAGIFTNTPFVIYMYAMLLMTVTGLVLLLLFRKQFKVEEPIEPLPEGKYRYAIICNPGFWIMTGFCIYEFLNQIFAG